MGTFLKMMVFIVVFCMIGGILAQLYNFPEWVKYAVIAAASILSIFLFGDKQSEELRAEAVYKRE